MDPVPTLGGGISAADMVMAPGGFDQRGRPGVIGCHDTLPLNARRDVLTFQTSELESDTEVTGPIEMRLWASSSALDTDFTAKLIDVYPPSDNFPDGLAFNITDSIIRARYRNGWDSPENLEPGSRLRVRIPALPDIQRLPQGPPDKARHQQQQLAPLRRQPQHRRPARGRQGLHHRHPDHLPRARPGLPRHPAAARLTLHIMRNRVPRCGRNERETTGVGAGLKRVSNPPLR